MFMPWHVTHFRFTTASPPFSAVDASRLDGSGAGAVPAGVLLLLPHAEALARATTAPTTIKVRCQLIPEALPGNRAGSLTQECLAGRVPGEAFSQSR
jgi:hypothetical protein